MDVACFTRAHIEAAAWADCGPDHETHGKDWAPETIARFKADGNAFYKANRDDIHAYEAETGSNAGHDFWFTRRGHGVGFWEHDTPAAGRLGKAAKAAGDIDLYLGDDDLVYAG